jgi:KaiC/GvpD/RAD55 family RecA-like ATPase
MAEKKQTLSENYLIELFKACLTSKNVLEVVNIHLVDNFLPEQTYKNVWNAIKESFLLTNHVPTIGILNEKLKNDSNDLKILLEIKKCKIPDVEIVFPTFEAFIKEVRFIELYTDVGKTWNKGDQEAAIKKLAKESEEINSFSLNEGLYGKIFLDFDKRQEERKNKEVDHLEKVPFGIHCMDFDTHGGGKIGTSGLLLARSGTGKTTFEVFCGISCARNGGRVVHFQIEGTGKELEEMYDASWTGASLSEIEFGNLKKENVTKIKNINQDIINKGGEIFVVAPESFDSLSIESCNDTIEEIEKNYGKVSLAIFDNISSFTVKGKFSHSEQGERNRREAIANKITNIAVQKKLFSLATEQANDITPHKFNNPDFVMTRSDISEFKGMLRPFSYFWTWNQSSDEYEANVGRIYNDKFRKFRSGQIRKICCAFNNARFYDSSRTLQTFWNAKENRPL